MHTILHIDCNNAFLSWEAAYQLTKGSGLDIRTVPAVIASQPSVRTGIVLASSYPAKKHGIKTAMTVNDAKRRCPNLRIFPPDYDTYINCSNELLALLLSYSPKVERYSIDECFIDLGEKVKEPVKEANLIREKIKKELGFSVNIGVSNNKLLAKIASGFSKPDKTHTLYKNELEEKLFPLPVYSLFMAGIKTCIKLYKLGYKTIGQVAKEDPSLLQSHFKLFGLLLWSYANGIDRSKVLTYSPAPKGFGNSTTLPEDVEDKSLLHPFILSLTERCSRTLRNHHMVAATITIGIKTNDYRYRLHQRKLQTYTNHTNTIYTVCKELLDEIEVSKPIKQVSVRVTSLSKSSIHQQSIFEDKTIKIDQEIDKIRDRYGERIIKRAVFLHSGIDPIMEKTSKDYPKIKSNIFNGED